MKNREMILAAILFMVILVGCSTFVPLSITPQEEPVSTSSSVSQLDDPTPSMSNQDEWQLRLVNAHYTLEKELDIELAEVGGRRFDARIVSAVEALLAAAEKDGINLTIISGYRTMDRSHTLYTNKVQEYVNAGYTHDEAVVEAARWVAPPGTSEHHTGLAMDIISSNYYTKYSDLVEDFEKEPEAIWLQENCAKFGFILRFPKGKEAITGIHYEPWHFRYVGEEAAQEIMAQGICLEEYLGVG